jgi:hypothetical protein
MHEKAQTEGVYYQGSPKIQNQAIQDELVAP